MKEWQRKKIRVSLEETPQLPTVDDYLSLCRLLIRHPKLSAAIVDAAKTDHPKKFGDSEFLELFNEELIRRLHG